MSIMDYMQSNNGSNITMIFDSLPDKGYVDAIKVRDICKARIAGPASRANMQHGSPDVNIKSITGENIWITRDQLSKQYIHTNGSKITIAFLKNDKDYLVLRTCNENYKVIQIPDNCVGSIAGNKIKAGTYMVAKQNEDGSLNRDTIYPVNQKLFRKSFIIPMQGVIKRNLGKGSRQFTLLNNQPLRNNSTRINPNINNERVATPKINISDLGMNPKNIKVPTVSDKLRKQSVNVMKSEERNIPVSKSMDTKYRFKVTNRVVDMSNNLIGFMVVDLKTNASRKLTQTDLAKLCERKLVENVMIVTKEKTGIKFLKGNGIVLNNLPPVIG